MKLKQLFIFACIVFCSCSQDKKTTGGLKEIHIDPSKPEAAYDLASYIEESDVVALETTDDCLVTGIDKVVFKNGTYYILDRKGCTVFLFDSTGKFISKLHKKGRGPDEYSAIESFDVVGKNIWVSDDNLRFLIGYDESFQMIDRVHTWDIMSAKHITFMNGNIYMVSNWATNIQFGMYDIQNKKITGLCFVPEPDPEIPLRVLSNQIAPFGNSCLFMYSYCDTIFQSDGLGFVPKYKVIFSERYKDIRYTMDELLAMFAENSNIIIGMDNIKQTEHKIFIGYEDTKRYMSAVYDKETGSCKVYSSLTNSNLNNIKFWQYMTFFDEENIISVHDPNVILDTFGKDTDFANIKDKSVGQQIKTVVSTLDSFSNPVLIRHKLKQNSGL